jgi:hypothetical protein
MSEVGVLMFGVFYGPESQQRRRKSQCFEQTNEESTKFEFHQPTSAPMQSLFYKTFSRPMTYAITIFMEQCIFV